MFTLILVILALPIILSLIYAAVMATFFLVVIILNKFDLSNNESKKE